MALALTEIKIYSYSTPYSDTATHKFVVPVTDKCERSAQIMADDTVRLSFNSESLLQLNVFDYIYYDEQFFFLKNDYTPKNIGSDGTTAAYYAYDVKFFSVANMLEKFAFIRQFQVLPEQATVPITCYEPEIELNGNLEVFGQLIGESLEYLHSRISNSFVQFKRLIGQLCTRDSFGAFSNIVVKADTDMVTVSFNGNFADFITTVVQQYTEPDKKVEWYITKDNVLHIDKCQIDSETLLSLDDSVYMADRLNGNRTGGLISVEYAQEQNPLPQYIIPYGSDRNIESKMGQQESINLAVSFGKRLRLDPDTSYEVEQGKFITTDAAGRVQLLDNQQRPIINTGIELVKFYEDVYPQGHFCVDEVVEKFKTIDGVKQPRYEIRGYAVTNDYRGAEDWNEDHEGNKFIPKDDERLQGVFPIDIVNTETLSINFESGFLNGREFEVANKTTKDAGENVRTYSVAFSIIADGDIKEGTLLPSGNCIPHQGDKFAIFNMVMPSYYIEQAKNELAKACYKELLELYNTKPEIKCKTDEKWFTGMRIELGTQVLVSSLNLNVAIDGTRSEKSRVIAFSYSLTHPNKIDFTLSSAISEGRLTGLETLIAEQGVQISGTQQRAINLSKRGWRDQSEMADMLNSLTAEMMLVGEEKYQFAYSFGIECNQDMSGHEADTRTEFLHFTAGQLAHTQEPYIGYDNKGVWYLSDKEVGFVGTDEGDLITDHPDVAYYVYAVCAPNAINATIELHDARQDDEAYMQLGILSSEFEDNGTHFRVFNRTNGYTAISGGTLTTEQIQDYNRNLIIDFQSNPPRIIARNRAQIIGNIQFLRPDGSTKTIDEIGIGGENLIGEINPFMVGSIEHTGYTFKSIIGGKNVPLTETTNPRCVNENYLKNGSTYTFSVERVVQEVVPTQNGDYQTVFALQLLCLQIDNPDLPAKDGVSYSMPIQDTLITKVFTVPNDGYNYRLRLTNGMYQSGSEPPYHGRLTFYNMMLQEGEIKTTYQPYVNRLVESFESAARDAVTEVEGGLVATSLIQMRDPSTGQVNAGLSGVTKDKNNNPENVLLWGGGTYADALYASTHDYYKSSQLNAFIQTLLKKDGTGKIGVFYVEEDKVVIKTPNGIIAIDDDKGILMYRGTDLTVPPYVEIRPNAISADELPQYKDYTTSIVKTTDTPFPSNSPFRPNPYLPRFVEILTFTPLDDNNKLTISQINIHITLKTARLTNVAEMQFIDFEPQGDASSWGIKFTLEMRIDGNTISSFSRTKGVTSTGSAGLNDTFTLPPKTITNVNGSNHNVSIYLKAMCIHLGEESDEFSVRIPQGTDVTYTLACTEFSLNNEYNKTLIGTNGILAAHNGNNYFFIDNSVDNKQKITIKGLPDVEHANAGQLYKDSNGYLKIR